LNATVIDAGGHHSFKIRCIPVEAPPFADRNL
jgi:hypothetical protein